MSRDNSQDEPSRPKKPWTILFYLCGDNDSLEQDLTNDYWEICEVGSSPEVHIVIQFDRPGGVIRRVLSEDPAENLEWEAPDSRVSVNTGDPLVAKSFIRWAIREAPSEHLAIFFSGMGINPAYVHDVLLPHDSFTMQEILESIEEDEDQDCLDEADLEALARIKRRDFIQKHLFTICHDQGSRAALEVKHLKSLMAEAGRDREGRKVDVVGFDLGVTAFLEIAFQVRDHARYFCAPQSPLPDDGWPYERILREWTGSVRRGIDDPAELSRLIVDAVHEKYIDRATIPMVAVNLSRLAMVARSLDSMSLALLQSLGELHVLNAFRQALRSTERVSPELGESLADSVGNSLNECDSATIPGVDVVLGLTALQQSLLNEKECVTLEYGCKYQKDQQAVLELLARLASEALRALCADAGTRRGLFLHARPHPTRGLSIFLPAQRDVREIEERTGIEFEISNETYLNLDFSGEIHWPAVLGVYMLISEKPYALWSLVSRLLATGSGSDRDRLLGQLVSQQETIGGLTDQFKSLASDIAMTLTLEPESLRETRGEQDTSTQKILSHTPEDSPFETEDDVYVLRFDAAGPAAIVGQIRSRVSRRTIGQSLSGLEDLLRSSEIVEDLEDRLQGLGQTLGEDLIQDFGVQLKAERKKMLDAGASVPHLRLQIPLTLMRYPWELLGTGDGLLCERFALGRQVLMPARFSRPIGRRHNDGLQALIIADPKFTSEHMKRVKQLPGAQEEGRTVCSTFRRLNDELAAVPAIQTTTLIGEEVTVFQMRQFLRSNEFDIIHFAGHAYYDERNPRNSAWLLSDGLLRAFEIRNTLRWCERPPWLVYANACEAAMDGRIKESRSSSYESGVFGLATAFINHGTAAYLAPLWPIDDAIASSFAERFYDDLLLKHSSLGAAVYRAKEEIKKQIQKRREEQGPLPSREALSWASMVLYGEPTPHVLEALWTPSGGY